MSKRPIVLVIDDEVRSQETLRRVLEGDEYQVLTAGSAVEAERILESEMVDIILCDQRMPGMTGVEFLKRARDMWPDAVRMIISGYSDSEDIIAGLNDAGIYQYITKPWDPEELLSIAKGSVELMKLQRDSAIATVEMKQAAAPVKKTSERNDGAVEKTVRFFPYRACAERSHGEGFSLG